MIWRFFFTFLTLLLFSSLVSADPYPRPFPTPNPHPYPPFPGRFHRGWVCEIGDQFSGYYCRAEGSDRVEAQWNFSHQCAEYIHLGAPLCYPYETILH